MKSVKALIQLLQEIDGCLVHTALLVSHPVDNAAYGIHAQTVEMVLGQPVIGRGHHEAHDFPSGIDKIACSPLTVRDVACRVLVELGAVVFFEGVVVICKMRRDKIDNSADARVVQPVDQLFQLRCCAIAGCWREKSGLLISPASVKRMLGQRHEFNMRKVVLLQICNQIIRNLIILVPTVRVGFISLPGTQMQLINIQRLIVIESSLLHPLLV